MTIYNKPTKSRIFITDNMVINSSKHYNWFQKLMYKLLLGWIVEEC